ncbi:MAG: sulfatase-like hydrolase/transferase [Verrucomicrobiota bacterium]
MRLLGFLILGLSGWVAAAEKPNIVILFSDDISARELPIYGSTVWTSPTKGDTSDTKYRAQTPVLDRMAAEGCWVTTTWSATICGPSRAMMMTGRYAHLHKWWHNKDKGTYVNEKGKVTNNWPLYLSSPKHLGHVAQDGGYATYWAGKTQMSGDWQEFGYDEGCFTPGSLANKDNPFTDFKHEMRKVDGKRQLVDVDTGVVMDTYMQHGWYFYPHVRLMNHGGKRGDEWWPNTEESKEEFGLATYGPDVELDFIFDFMERKVKEEKPFLIYHCSHLGHDAWDWLNPDSTSKWPGTPVVNWTGEGYERVEVKITGDEGEYETYGTVTEAGIHTHVNYLDYQVWLYLKKFEELGISDNTVFVFTSDNGTSGYGKGSVVSQRGVHVPLIVWGAGVTKTGKQEALVNLSDFLPTVAELTGGGLPERYEHNGESLVPFLFGDAEGHRDWIYAYHKEQQMIRGGKVMRDGRGDWYDVSKVPDDLGSFPKIREWKKMPPEFRRERKELEAVLPEFDKHAVEHDAPRA